MLLLWKRCDSSITQPTRWIISSDYKPMSGSLPLGFVHSGEDENGLVGVDLQYSKGGFVRRNGLKCIMGDLNPKSNISYYKLSVLLWIPCSRGDSSLCLTCRYLKTPLKTCARSLSHIYMQQLNE